MLNLRSSITHSRARDYVTLIALRLCNFSLLSVFGLLKCIICRRDEYWGGASPLSDTDFFTMRSHSVYTRSVRGQKLIKGPISYYRGFVCVGFTINPRLCLRARRVCGAECIRAKRVRASSLGYFF